MTHTAIDRVAESVVPSDVLLTCTVEVAGTTHPLTVTSTNIEDHVQATTNNGVIILAWIVGCSDTDMPMTVFIHEFINTSGVRGLGKACLSRLLEELVHRHPSLEWVNMTASSLLTVSTPGSFSDACFATRYPAAHKDQVEKGATMSEMLEVYSQFCNTEQLVAYYEAIGLQLHDTDVDWKATHTTPGPGMCAPVCSLLLVA